MPERGGKEMGECKGRRAATGSRVESPVTWIDVTIHRRRRRSLRRNCLGAWLVGECRSHPVAVTEKETQSLKCDLSAARHTGLSRPLGVRHRANRNGDPPCIRAGNVVTAPQLDQLAVRRPGVAKPLEHGGSDARVAEKVSRQR